MAASFFFYDLETSGLNARAARIMQFAGQRTDMDLNPIDEPVNVLIKLTPDVLPDPDAILITGITPQQTISDGISEATFLKLFTGEIAKPETIFVGYNTVRFDDEFIRFLHYRNFYDAYEWAWKDGRSRWDLLDVVRMTRALRPNGIDWPFAPNGKPSNRLELIAARNKLDHQKAHDALSDVQATIAVAQLVHSKQLRLFDYLLGMRVKHKVAELVQKEEPFLYTSGSYPSEFAHTAVVTKIADHPKKQGVLVYDLRFDPTEFFKMTPNELVEAWRWKDNRRETDPRLPVKVIQFNRCPAVAPLNVLDKSSQERLRIDLAVVEENRKKLMTSSKFVSQLMTAIDVMDKAQQAELIHNEQSVDTQLYEGFMDDQDRRVMNEVRSASPSEITHFMPSLRDQRLKALLPLFKARNYPNALSTEEQEQWQKFCSLRLTTGGPESRLAKYLVKLDEKSAQPGLTKNQRYLLEELRLYGESLVPSAD